MAKKDGYHFETDSTFGRPVDLMGSFSQLAGHVDPAANLTKSNTPKETLLESIAPNLNTKVNIANVEQHKLQTGTSVAVSAQVAPNREVVNNVGNQIQDTKANISETIRQAQKEVVAAAKAEGISAGALYPDTRMAAGNEIGLVMQAAMQGVGAQGMGSLVTSVSNAAQSIDTIMSDRKSLKNMSKQDAEEAVRSRLIASASNPAQPKETFSQVAMTAHPDQQVKPAQQLDWKNFFEQGHELKDLMALDPDDPNPAIVPEWGELSEQETVVAEVQDNLDHTEDHAFDTVSTGEIGLALSRGKVLEDVVPMVALVRDVADTIPALKGLKLAKDDAINLSAKVASDAPWALSNEFDPEKLGLKRNASPAPVGAM